MSEQQFYETVQRQQEWEEDEEEQNRLAEQYWDRWTQGFLEESANDKYCPYCLSPQAGRSHCCGESDFVPLKSLPLDSQAEIVNNEYDEAYK
jgi:hypothetical protein